MKKLFTFLSAMAFISQAYAMSDDVILEVSNKTPKKLAVTAILNDRYDTTFKLVLEPSDTECYSRSRLGSLYKGHSGEKIKTLSIYDYEASSSTQSPQQYNFGDELIITNELLKGWQGKVS